MHTCTFICAVLWEEGWRASCGSRCLQECRWSYGMYCAFGRLGCVWVMSKTPWTTGDKLPVFSQVAFRVGQGYSVHGLKTSSKSLSLLGHLLQVHHTCLQKSISFLGPADWLLQAHFSSRIVIPLFACEAISSRSKATSIMQRKASLSTAGSTAHLTSEPSQTSHAKCRGHAGHPISWRLPQAVPKARLGSQQGWS